MLEWLLSRYPGTPRTRAKQWILAGRVAVRGTVMRRPHEEMSDPGDSLQLRERVAHTLDCGPGWEIHARLALVYLDASLAVVNKGAGLISVPAPHSKLSALEILADFLAGRSRASAAGATGRKLPGIYRRLEPLPVHRLDQYTTGLFCMAMNPAARGGLIAQLKAHTMRREYVAFVEGRPPQPKGTWRQWLELSEDELKQHVLAERRAGTRPGARQGVTHYEVLEEFPLPDGKAFVSKLRLRLETGLKHQIRVHAAHAGLPLIGDRTYNPRYRAQLQAVAPIPFSRQALHSETLTLEHPERPGAQMTWTAPLPGDLVQLEARLRARRGL